MPRNRYRRRDQTPLADGHACAGRHRPGVKPDAGRHGRPGEDPGRRLPARIAEIRRTARAADRGRMPSQRGIGIGEKVLARHVDLRAPRLLRGAAMDADGAGRAGPLHHALEREGRTGAAGADHAVAAAMPDLGPGRARHLARLGGVAEARPRVMLRQMADPGAAAALAPLDQGRHAGSVAAGDAKALDLDLADVEPGGFRLVQRQFGHGPDLARDAQDRLAQRLDHAGRSGGRVWRRAGTCGGMGWRLRLGEPAVCTGQRCGAGRNRRGQQAATISPSSGSVGAMNSASFSLKKQQGFYQIP